MKKRLAMVALLLAFSQAQAADVCPNPRGNLYVVVVEIRDHGSIRWNGGRMARTAFGRALRQVARERPEAFFLVNWDAASRAAARRVTARIRQYGFSLGTNCRYRLPF